MSADLLVRARAATEVTSLPNTAKRGAEAYFQSYEYVAAGNPDEPAHDLRQMASEYLEVTASPPLTDEEEQGARVAFQTLEQLQSGA